MMFAEAAQSTTIDPIWLSPAFIVVAVWFLWLRMGRAEDRLAEVAGPVARHVNTYTVLTAKLVGLDRRMARREDKNNRLLERVPT